MACSKEEIEGKRLAALQKRQTKLSCSNNSFSFEPSSPIPTGLAKHTKVGPLKGHTNYTKSHPYKKNVAQDDLTKNEASNNFKVVSGTVYLISENRFEVYPTEFCTPLINVFKTIPSRNYDARSKLWNFSIDDYQELISKVAPLAPYVVLGSIPHNVLKVLQEPTVDPNSIDLTPIEATLRNKLMPFQQEGVRFAIARRGRCMIADDMGLGKTFQALAVASYYRHNWPLLIVTTSSMRETWQSKIHELLPSVPLMNIVTLTSSKDAQMVADKQTQVVIVSYKITIMHTDLLRSKKFGVTIIDESHNLKSHKAQCTISLRSVCKSAARVILLSGTPALSRPVELYTQLNIIDDKMFNNYTEYGKRYCAGKQTSFGWDMTGQSNLTELQIILQKRFLIRRTKEQVLDSLEGKIRESVLLDETLLQFSKEDQLELSQLAQKCNNTRDKHTALITFFAESARVKIPAICKYLKQLLSSDFTEKFLIFAHHKNMIDAICLQLDELRVNYICIVGSTPANRRAELVDKFQHSPSVKASVLSVSAAGAGITLTRAALVLFAELHWNPGILTQAEARAHRIGQQSTVTVRYLLARGTADDYMWPMLHHKLNVLNDVGLSKDNFEDTTTTHQESSVNITKYLLPTTSFAKNKNDYIPGTNIRKGTLASDKSQSTSKISNENKSFSDFNAVNSVICDKISDTCDKTSDTHDKISYNSFDVSGELEFFDDNEGDQLLADIDL